MKRLSWTERSFTVGQAPGMVPYFLERLSGGPARVEEKVNGIPEALLAERLEDKWSVKQNIGHLAELDEVSLLRLEDITRGAALMAAATPSIQQQDYNVLPLQELLAYFRSSRATLLARYSAISDEELVLTSLHPRLKIAMTPVDLAYFHSEHDDYHLVRIQEIITTLTR